MFWWEENNMNFIKKSVCFTNKYIRENLMKCILVNGIAFVVFTIIVFLIVKTLPDETLREIFNGFAEMVGADGKSTTALEYFAHNFRIDVVMGLLGMIPFLFLPILVVIFNAGLLGAAVAVVGELIGESSFMWFIKYILPHGIFEIPAMIIAGAMGTRLCIFLCRKILKKANDEKFSYHIKGCIGTYIVYLILMVLIAGIIESSLPLIYK